MKTLKALILIMLCTTVLNTIAQEQPKTDPQQVAQKRTDKIEGTINGITTDEVSKILTIEQDYAKNVQDVRTTNNGDKEITKTKIEALRLDRDTQIKAILTPDQYTQYLQMQDDEKSEEEKNQVKE